MLNLAIRPTIDHDKSWIRQFIIGKWGSDIIVVHSEIFHPAELPGFVAEVKGQKLGLMTYFIDNLECEIISLDSLKEKKGIGSALIDAVKKVASQTGCRRLWLITTNDNIDALRFYQKRGFILAAIHRNAVQAARKIKPQIPQVGNAGIPIRDEIELELLL